jgi:hypothetical protein
MATLILSGLLVGWAGFSFNTAFGNYNCTNWLGYPDRDCDQLADDWETSGYGGIDFPGPTYQANKNIKDIYLEIDYRGHHIPLAGVTAAVTTAFANSGVANYPGYAPGIQLHIFVNENMGNPGGDPCTDMSTFGSIKNTWFGFSPSERSNPTLMAAKRQTFHYGIFIHSQCLPALPGSSGSSEIRGNDLAVSLGSFAGGIGSAAEQKGTLMHELGHNLGLLHGGNNDINCKPNYLSVMNWAFQFPTYAINPLDYSKNAWLGLDENDLSEPAGIGTADYQTAIGGGSPAPLVNGFKATGTGIDYNRDGDTTDLHVVRNLNNFGYPGTPSESSCNSNIFTKYYGAKDWGDWLQYWGPDAGWSSGAPVPLASGAPSNSTAAMPINASAINSSQVIQQGTLLGNNTNQSSSTDYLFNHSDVTIDFVRTARLQILEGINHEIQVLPDSAFKNPGTANMTKADFEQELVGTNSSIANLTQSDKLGEAIEALNMTRAKMDSNFGGDPNDDLIVDKNAQQAVVALIDNLIQVLVQQR